MTAELSQFTPGSYTGSRPLMRINPRTGKPEMRINRADGFPLIRTPRGLMVNSLLRHEEWRLLDMEIQQAALIRLNGVADLQSRGLTRPISSFGTLTSEWNQASEMTAAQINMTGQGNAERDRVEFSMAGVPIPVVFKDFTIGQRQLEAARLMGNQLDTTHAAAAARVVAEMLETMLFNGATVPFDSRTLTGLTNHASVNTASAAGDWGTISNIVPTITTMINALTADRYFGPYALYVATTQYNEAATSFYTDGSGESALNRILRIPQISAVQPSDTLAAGSLVLFQATSDVVDWAQHMGVTLVEWMSGDGMVSHFKALAVAAPRVKADFNGRSGICVATGA